MDEEKVADALLEVAKALNRIADGIESLDEKWLRVVIQDRMPLNREGY